MAANNPLEEKWSSSSLQLRYKNFNRTQSETSVESVHLSYQNSKERKKRFLQRNYELTRQAFAKQTPIVIPTPQPQPTVPAPEDWARVVNYPPKKISSTDRLEQEAISNYSPQMDSAHDMIFGNTIGHQYGYTVGPLWDTNGNCIGENTHVPKIDNHSQNNQFPQNNLMQNPNSRIAHWIANTAGGYTNYTQTAPVYTQAVADQHTNPTFPSASPTNQPMCVQNIANSVNINNSPAINAAIKKTRSAVRLQRLRRSAALTAKPIMKSQQKTLFDPTNFSHLIKAARCKLRSNDATNTVLNHGPMKTGQNEFNRPRTCAVDAAGTFGNQTPKTISQQYDALWRFPGAGNTEDGNLLPGIETSRKRLRNIFDGKPKSTSKLGNLEDEMMKSVQHQMMGHRYTSKGLPKMEKLMTKSEDAGIKKGERKGGFLNDLVEPPERLVPKKNTELHMERKSILKPPTRFFEKRYIFGDMNDSDILKQLQNELKLREDQKANNKKSK